MRYGSVCSGIEAATVAWHSLGWTPQWFSEIEPFPSAVLAHHYPNVPNFGDMTKFKEWKLDDTTAINVLVGGTPCQSFSVAGLRKGLEDPRGNLMLTYLAIANKYRPKWLVWENVPGVLSSNGGNDFASFLRGLGELGYGFAYRVFDAQHFGVPQRRRRVFVIGCLGNWRSAAAVLFERHSLSGHPAPSRKARKSPPGFFESSLAQYRQADVGGTLKASGGVLGGGSETFLATPIALAEDTIGRKPENGGNGDGFTVGGPMYTLNATGVHGVAQPIPLNSMTFGRINEKTSRQCLGIGEPGDPVPTLSKTHHHAVATPVTAAFKGGQGSGAGGIGYSEHVAPTLPASDGGNRTPTLLQHMAVRRLTPTECERLQGFPDNYTNIPWRKKEESPDGPRYKALGNSMAVPVMYWIGKRIADAP